MALGETVGFVGFGNMGSAMLRGLLAKAVVTPENARVYDPDESRCAEARALGAAVSADAAAVVAESSTVVLAVKPQTMQEALSAISSEVTAQKRFVSIAAGVPIAVLQRALGTKARIIRVMPNTPAMVGAGAAAIAVGPNCDAADAEVARAIFEAVGSCEFVEEPDLDVVTALSGSGPAYFFYMAECLAKAAVDEGLPEDQATRLAVQTLYGAGKLLHDTGESAVTLRNRVTSKGGTTAAALAAFQEHGLAAVMAAGLKAAAARARELGR